MELVKFENNEMTMSSFDLRVIVNEARSAHGQSEVENSHFLRRIEDELDGDIGEAKKFRHPQSGVTIRYYDLTRDQCMLVGMRESKGVRRSVLVKLKGLDEPRLPDFSDPAAAAEAWAEQYRKAQHATATKAEIGSRREATAMNTASRESKRASRLEVDLDVATSHSTIKRMEILTGLKFNWRLLKSAEQDLGIERTDVPDANYGTVRSYHADAWAEAYAMSIKQEDY